MAGKRRNGITMKITGKNKRPNTSIRDVPMNFAIMNCRSLKYKLDSLAENFTQNKYHFILTNETWFKARDPRLKDYLDKMQDKYYIKCVRKD